MLHASIDLVPPKGGEFKYSRQKPSGGESRGIRSIGASNVRIRSVDDWEITISHELIENMRVSITQRRSSSKRSRWDGQASSRAQVMKLFSRQYAAYSRKNNLRSGSPVSLPSFRNARRRFRLVATYRVFWRFQQICAFDRGSQL